MRVVRALCNLIEVQKTRTRLVAETNEPAKRRQAFAAQLSRLAVCDAGAQLADHRNVVARLEPRCDDERLAADAVDGELELCEPVGGIDVDEHQAGFGCRELRDDPLGAVRSPDAHACAGLEPERQQACGERVNARAELCVAPVHVLVRDDERLAIRETPGARIEAPAHRLSLERLVTQSVDIAQSHFRLTKASSGRRVAICVDLDGDASAARVSPGGRIPGRPAAPTRWPFRWGASPDAATLAPRQPRACPFSARRPPWRAGRE